MEEDLKKPSMDELIERARDYMTIAFSSEEGREIVEESRLELVTDCSEVLDKLPSGLAEEVSNVLIDDGILKMSREGHKDTSPSDKEEQT